MGHVQSLERRRFLSVSLLKDVLPGTGGSGANWHVEAAGKLFFTADDGTHGNEQFVSDGTPDGTKLVFDINPVGSSSPAWHTRVGDLVYFTADDGVHGRELWKTDGTAAGTQMVADIHPTGAGIPLVNTWLTNHNGTLYFAGTNGIDGVELWKSDGTAAGTQMVADLRAGDASPWDVFSLGDKLLFSVIDATHGRELWVLDGGGSPTLVKDINTIAVGGATLSSTPNSFAALNGVAYFRAVDVAATGVELWRTDGTEAGTYLVKDINPTGSSQPFGFRELNGALFFQATTGSSDTELWRTDGTAAGTVLVKDINAGTSGSSPSNLTPFNGELWFSAEGFTTGRELWATDGTAANTRLVKDIRVASSSSNPDWFTVFNNTFYFAADDGSTGKELWRSDGTPAGTARVLDLNPGTASSSILLPRVLRNAMHFFATTPATGSEYWKLAPPQATLRAYDVDSRTIRVSFDQDVTVSTNAGFYSLVTVPSTVPISISSVAYDAPTRTATFTTLAPLADGNYRFTLPPGTVTDTLGNRLIGTNTVDFFTLAGDVNHDRTVGFDDLLIVAQNYGQSGRTFSQGNVDYSADGLVGFDDLLKVAQRYGVSVPALILDPRRMRATPTIRLLDSL